MNVFRELGQSQILCKMLPYVGDDILHHVDGSGLLNELDGGAF